MERNRESRRSSKANGFQRRRHQAIALRDSSEEGALRETPSKRGRNRDKDSSNRNKRRKASHSQTTEEEEEEDSVGNEQDDDVSLLRSTNTTSFASDQNHRRSFAPAKPPPLKVTDEMIGVAVPRKARSVSVKRSSSGGGGGGGEELNFRLLSSGRDSVEPASPSSSNVSARKMKSIGAVTKTSKSCSSDMDIEMAELLCGLMTSNNHERKDVEEKYSTSELVRIQSEQTADLNCHDGNATGHENGSSETPKKDNGESVSPTRESPSCSKLDVDKQNSASARVMSAVPEANSQQVGNFEIDLMAPPPMMLSPKGDGLSRGDFTSKTKSLALDVEMKREDSIKVEEKVELERSVKKEKTLEEIKEAKMFDFTEKRDVPNHGLEKPNNDNDIKTNDKLEEQDRSKEQPTKTSNTSGEKTAQSSSALLSTTVSGRPNSLSSIGYTLTPPLQTVVKTDKTTGALTTLQHVNFALSQPQPKRCATHHYIARNIFLHKQFTKMKPHLPAAVGSDSLCGTKPNNVNSVPSTEIMVVGKQSSKQLPGVNQNGTQEKGWAAATSDPSLAAIISSNNANPMNSTQRMQLVLQQSPHPGLGGNQVHGPPFLFPPGQHQASAAISQAGGVNSTNSASSNSKSHSSAARSLGNSSTLPEVAAAMSFRYPKFSASDTPYVTIVQNNGYSFPFSTSLGATAAIRGTSPAQAAHIVNGPFYSSQIFHPLQHPQQDPHTQALVQPSYLTASTSSSSPSHKQSQCAPVNGNNILTSTTMQPQQLQKQQTSLSHPRQHGTEMSGENAPSVANRTCYPQKNVHRHNYTVPVQPVDFSFRPSATSDLFSGNGQNFGDKQQQQQALKGGVEVIPSQAFAISFAAFNGTSVPSNLNFSSMAQNPVIFQSLPNIAWQGYQAASTSHTTQKMTYSITEGNQDDEKKTTHGKSSTNGPTTLVFDNSSKNLNFVLSPTNGNWPGLSIASTAITSVPLSSNASSSQQPSQLLQHQKQHGMQQQQPAMATRYKALSTDTTATKFANNAPVFSQTGTQCKSSNQGSHSKSSGRTTDSHVHQTSVIKSNTPTLKSFSQEQGRVSQSHIQISFAGNCITSLPPQGQQLVNSNKPLCTAESGTPLTGGYLKPNSEGRKVHQ